MCGIIGYTGKRKSIPVILDGLKRLEYRGYDSAGIASVNKDKSYFKKSKGRVEALESKIDNFDFQGISSIGHTRWATHGVPSSVNAHPHKSCDGKIFLIHNGIIENYLEIKKKLLKKKHKFVSQTDTEVVVHLIEDFVKKGLSFQEAVESTLKTIKGTYALAVINSDEPEKLIVARNSSPLLIGIGKGENFIASDASAILPYTREVIYLNDGEYAVVTPNDFEVLTLGKGPVRKKKQLVEWSLEEVTKQGFPHFMLKEIYEEPQAVENAIKGRIVLEEGLAKLGGLESVENNLLKLKRIIISACGTANIASMVGEYLLEEYGGIPTEVELASELRYRNPVFDKSTALLSVSQSGETIDTLAALKEAKRKKLLNLGIVNVVGSTIARETDAGVYNHAGPEIGVASTKAFVSQLSVLVLLSVFMGRQRNLSLAEGKNILKELTAIPKKMDLILKTSNEIKKIAKKYLKYNNFLYLGRKYNYPIALEGALKLKEISYVHAEGYSAGEMKHGPIAMIDKNFPSIFIVPSDSVYEKVISNIQEVKARGGRVLAIATKGNKEIKKIADDVIYIPKTIEPLYPFLTALPLHLFAYHFAALRGHDIDKPRNLAKSVTVE